MLTATEIAAMQEIEESVMPSTAYVLSRALTGDGMGGYAESWGTVGTVVCDLWPINKKGDREPVIGGQVTSAGDWYITIPFDATIDARNRVEVGSRTFEVTFVPNGSSWQTAKRVEARLLNEERRV